jgi:hypothetical protein
MFLAAALTELENLSLAPGQLHPAVTDVFGWIWIIYVQALSLQMVTLRLTLVFVGGARGYLGLYILYMKAFT